MNDNHSALRAARDLRIELNRLLHDAGQVCAQSELDLLRRPIGLLISHLWFFVMKPLAPESELEGDLYPIRGENIDLAGQSAFQTTMPKTAQLDQCGARALLDRLQSIQLHFDGLLKQIDAVPGGVNAAEISDAVYFLMGYTLSHVQFPLARLFPGIGVMTQGTTA